MTTTKATTNKKAQEATAPIATAKPFPNWVYSPQDPGPDFAAYDYPIPGPRLSEDGRFPSIWEYKLRRSESQELALILMRGCKSPMEAARSWGECVRLDMAKSMDIDRLARFKGAASAAKPSGPTMDVSVDPHAEY